MALISYICRKIAPNRSRDTLVDDVQQMTVTHSYITFVGQAKYEIRRKCPIRGAVFQIRTIDAVYCYTYSCSICVKSSEKSKVCCNGSWQHSWRLTPQCSVK